MAVSRLEEDQQLCARIDRRLAAIDPVGVGSCYGPSTRELWTRVEGSLSRTSEIS